MAAAPSVDALMARLHAGDDEAAARVFRRYAGGWIALRKCHRRCERSTAGRRDIRREVPGPPPAAGSGAVWEDIARASQGPASRLARR
jgi:hypothetical protein